MALLTVIDVLMMVVGGVGIIYQAICVIMSLFSKPVHFPDAPMDKRYAVLISARNEENVIGNLIDSLHNQTYPSKLIDMLAGGRQPVPIAPPKSSARWDAMSSSATTRS